MLPPIDGHHAALASAKLGDVEQAGITTENGVSDVQITLTNAKLHRPKGFVEKDLLGRRQDARAPVASPADGRKDDTWRSGNAETIKAGSLAAAQRGSAASPDAGSALQDLAQAMSKAFSSGMGEWDLQQLEQASPALREHILRGPLGPENLRHYHALPERDMLRLYQLLHDCCFGFHSRVVDVVQRAAHSGELAEATWRGFALLWDETLRIPFNSHVTTTVNALRRAQRQLHQEEENSGRLAEENRQLQARLSDFVKTNLDHMLAYRRVKAQSDELEAEVTMLGSANAQLSVRAAAAEMKQQAVHVKLDGLGAKLATAQLAVSERDQLLREMQVACGEKDSTLRRQAQHAVQVEAHIMEMHRQQQSAAAHIAELQEQLAEAERRVEDANRRLADKTRAYNLLHSDYAFQKTNAEDAAQAMRDMQQRALEVEQHLADTHAKIARADKQHRLMEQQRLTIEDLRAQNRRLTERKTDLISSYWPVMQRLRELEAENAQLVSRGPIGTSAAAGSGVKPAAATAESTACGSASTSATASSNTVIAPPSAATAATATCSGTAHADHASAAAPPALAGSPMTAQGFATRNRLPVDVSSSSGSGTSTSHGSTEANLCAVRDELLVLSQRHELMQEEYWSMKSATVGLELEAGSHRAGREEAERQLARSRARELQLSSELAEAKAEIVRLDAEVLGCKAWVRSLEESEQRYMQAMRETARLGDELSRAVTRAKALEKDTASAHLAQRLVQLELDTVKQERDELVTTLSKERAHASTVEQQMQESHQAQVQHLSETSAQLSTQAAQEQQQRMLLEARLSVADEQQHQSKLQLLQAQHKLDATERDKRDLQAFLKQTHGVMANMDEQLQRMQERLAVMAANDDDGVAGSSGGGGGSSLGHVVESLDQLLDSLSAKLRTDANGSVLARHAATLASLQEYIVTLHQQLSRLPQSAGANALTAASVAAALEQAKQLDMLLHHSRCENAQVAAQLQVASATAAALTQEVAATGRTARTLEQQVAEQITAISRLQQQLQQQEAACTSAQRELAVALAEKMRLEQLLTALKAQSQLDSSQAGAATEAGRHVADQLESTVARVVELERQLVQATDKARQCSAQAEASASLSSSVRVRMQQLQDKIALLAATEARLKDELAAAGAQAHASSAEVQQAKLQLQEGLINLADTRQQLASVRHMLASEQTAYREVQAKLQQLRSELHAGAAVQHIETT